MIEEPRDDEGQTPEEDGDRINPVPESAPGEPGEATPDAGEEAPAEGDDAPAEGDAGEQPADPEAPGPEIEGLEELDQAETQEAPSEEAPSEEAPLDAAPSGEEQPRPRKQDKQGGDKEPEVIPGAHLEPDLVLEEQRQEGEYGEYDQYGDADAEGAEGEAGEDAAEPAPVAHTPLELAADARYNATGKRKSAIARVILKPGEGTYTVNGRHLDEYFPRVRLQRMASQPLEAAGYHTRMDVIARIHGGGVSAQANALRHGIARALVEADPALRTELKRRGYLTRDPREKERKKAGLKKARKRPQFSKR
jgi:small subunit ribosomal protein S9